VAILNEDESSPEPMTARPAPSMGTRLNALTPAENQAVDRVSCLTSATRLHLTVALIAQFSFPDGWKSSSKIRGNTVCM